MMTKYQNINTRIVSLLTKDLILKEHRTNTKTLSGYCYIVSEALYYIYGKELGFVPFVVKDSKNKTHWYLKNEGEWVDIGFKSTIELDYLYSHDERTKKYINYRNVGTNKNGKNMYIEGAPIE